MNLLEEIQRQIISGNCDLLSVLRTAHIVAKKLHLGEFDNWVNNELNGYLPGDKNIPPYRRVRGELRAFNPFRGYIPVIIENKKIAEAIENNNINEPISEVIDHYEKAKDNLIALSVPAELANAINKLSNPRLETTYRIFVAASQLKKIIEQVKDSVLQWTLKLEENGIKGCEMSFSNEEVLKAKEMASVFTTNNYYGSQVVYGNVVVFNYEDASSKIDEIIAEIKKTKELGKSEKKHALEMAEDAKEIIAKKESPKAIKYVMSALRDFALGVGASLLAGFIQSCFSGLSF